MHTTAIWYRWGYPGIKSWYLLLYKRLFLFLASKNFRWFLSILPWIHLTIYDFVSHMLNLLAKLLANWLDHTWIMHHGKVICKWDDWNNSHMQIRLCTLCITISICIILWNTTTKWIQMKEKQYANEIMYHFYLYNTMKY